MKLLESIGNIKQDTGRNMDFLKGIPLAQEIIPRVSKWDYVKI